MALLTPRHMSWFHAGQIAFWSAMIPVALFTHLKSSVPFLVMISLLALVFSEVAAWQGAMGERRQDPDDPYGDD